MNKKVYLAGPITGLSYEACIAWREDVTNRLRWFGIHCVNPMRGKYHLVDSKNIPPKTQGFMCEADEILTRDFNDCTTSDLIFVNFFGLN